MPYLEKEPRIDKFARPEHVLGVGKTCAQPDCARGLDNLVVNEIELAFIQLGLVVLAIGLDRQRSVRHLLLNFHKIGLRQRENQRDRLDLGYIHQAVGIGRMDDVPNIDLTTAIWSQSVGKESRRSPRSTRGSRRSF